MDILWTQSLIDALSGLPLDRRSRDKVETKLPVSFSDLSINQEVYPVSLDAEVFNCFVVTARFGVNPNNSFKASSLSACLLELRKNAANKLAAVPGSFVRDSFSSSSAKSFNFVDESENQNKANQVFNSTFFP